MINGKKIIALIPARSGSKSLPDKNIKLFKGKPLLAHSIIVAKSVNLIDEIYVSSDSEKYLEIAKEYGDIQVILRPKCISYDETSDQDVFKHFIFEYYNKNGFYPDIVVHLRPTYPLRTKQLLLSTLNTFMNNYDEYDSLRTVIPMEKSLFKMYTLFNNCLEPPYKKFLHLVEPHNLVRQVLPPTYLHNGCIDIVKYETIIVKNSMTGDKILPYIMDVSCDNDIDTLNDFIRAENSNLII